jgi:hydroxyacylglutathione hydrolase
MQIVPLPGNGPSSNCYLVLDGFALLIDTGCDERIVLSLRKLGIPPEAVQVVINTHCHFDHVRCNELFTEAKICLHSADAAQIEEMNDSVTLASSFKGEILPKVDRHLRDGDVIKMKTGSITVIHTPGHTAGSISLLTSTGVLFSGDTVFADSVGRWDLPTGSEAQLKRSLQLLSIKRFLNLYPGHGGPTTKDKLKTILEDGITSSLAKLP